MLLTVNIFCGALSLPPLFLPCTVFPHLMADIKLADEANDKHNGGDRSAQVYLQSLLYLTKVCCTFALPLGLLPLTT